MQNIFWTGYSPRQRHLAINEMQQTIARHGDLVDFQSFSDLSITVKIEIEERKVDLLYRELAQQMGMADFPGLSSQATRERVIFLNVSFAAGQGNLKTEIPEVPG
ncbi:MAG: hypothetical protein MUC97_02245 [Bernardetiaceae bacterium]|nr:hypothetical protein [Bernardetiaceae bacterium]